MTLHQESSLPMAIGLDVGDKRIGIAASDALGLTAQGLPTIHRNGRSEDLDALIRTITERNARCLVVGLPKNMDGSLGYSAEKVERFVGALLERMDFTGVPAPQIVYWDERLTTVAATKTLLEADVSRKKRKGAVDRIAAVLILQGYLDRQRRN